MDWSEEWGVSLPQMFEQREFLERLIENNPVEQLDVTISPCFEAKNAKGEKVHLENRTLMTPIIGLPDSSFERNWKSIFIYHWVEIPEHEVHDENGVLLQMRARQYKIRLFGSEEVYKVK